MYFISNGFPTGVRRPPTIQKHAARSRRHTDQSEHMNKESKQQQGKRNERRDMQVEGERSHDECKVFGERSSSHLSCLSHLSRLAPLIRPDEVESKKKEGNTHSSRV